MFKNKLKGYINNVTILLEEEWTMLPKVIEFDDDNKLMEEVKNLAAQGVSKDNLYDISHIDVRDKRDADNEVALTVVHVVEVIYYIFTIFILYYGTYND